MSRFIKMRDRDDQEIRATIEAGLQACSDIAANIKDCPIDGGELFWKICAGVDAYFEQRRRKDKALAYGQTFETPADPSSPAWDS
jgi:hypothetical protein